MQTSKIKIHSIYAVARSSGLARFHVTEIVTSKTSNDSPATNKIVGWFVEDRPAVGEATTVRLDPEKLIGPYDEQMELVERRRQEEAEAKARTEASKAQAMADRLALYKFVGVEPIAKADDYRQLFRVQGYNNSHVDITDEGAKAIIAKVNAMNAMMDEAERTNVVLPLHSFKG